MPDWSKLRHAYGSAADIPGTIAALRSDDEETRHDALGYLFASIVHQGSRFSASGPAAAPLYELVADRATPDRWALLRLLATIALGSDEIWLPGPVRVEDHDKDSLAAYRAVGAGRPLLRKLALDDPDDDVRVLAAYLLGWYPDEESLPVLAAMATDGGGAAGLAGDVARDDAEAAVAVVATGLIGLPAGVPLAERALADERPVVRWAGAIALTRLLGSAADPRAVHELIDWASGDRPADQRVPYRDGDLAGYALLSLEPFGADAFEASLARLPRVRAEEALTAVGVALRLAFPRGPIPSGTPFAQLAERQQRLATVLAGSPGTWLYDGIPFGNFGMLVAEYGLPGDQAKMAAYVRH